MENNKEIIHESEVKELIIELRGEKVLIDRDVAKLYGVETRDINKAVKIMQINSLKITVLACNYLKTGAGGKFPPVRKFEVFNRCPQSFYRTGIVYVGYYIKRSESYRNYFCHYRIIL